MKVEKNIAKKVEEIKRILYQEGYAGKLIRYQELQQLHQQYLKEVPEKIFAEEILGLPYYRLYAYEK